MAGGTPGNAGRFENRLAAPRPAEACSLWTQELHANCFGALCQRPEFNNVCCHAVIGVAFGVADENCSSAIFEQIVAALLAKPGRQDHNRNAAGTH